MKFGGSSLANFERVDHVANLIKDQIDSGIYRPRAIIVSAMGKTTNSLLSAGEFALSNSRVNIDPIRTLHTATMNHFDFPVNTKTEIESLLQEVRSCPSFKLVTPYLSPQEHFIIQNLKQHIANTTSFNLLFFCELRSCLIIVCFSKV
jgi:aspartate kinase